MTKMFQVFGLVILAAGEREKEIELESSRERRRELRTLQLFGKL